MRLVLLLVAACGSSPSDPATSPDASPADGMQPPANDSLYPLEVGRVFTYAVTSTYPSCPGGTREMRVLSKGTTEGRATFEVKGFCGLVGHTSVEGDRVEEYFDWGPKGWMRALDTPVQDGHTWQTTNGSATFGMRYSTTTVAGYDECWKVTQQVSYTTYWIYCRGAGLVRYELVDLGGGTIRAELVR
jgi:hypothetical protein